VQLHSSSCLRTDGETFPTPFAKPRGKGPFALIVEFSLRVFSFFVGVNFLSRHPVMVGLEPDFVALLLGAVFIGVCRAISKKPGSGTDPAF
jgi:hypothetical protein